MKDYTTKAISCPTCAKRSFRVVLLNRHGEGQNHLRLYCNSCDRNIDFAVGNPTKVHKGAPRRKNRNKEESL